MISPLAVTIAVTGHRHDGEVVIGQFQAGRHRQGAAMQPVEHVAGQVVRQLGPLADAGDDRKLVRLHVHVHQGLFQGAQDGEIPATRAPRRFLPLIIVEGDH